MVLVITLTAIATIIAIILIIKLIKAKYNIKIKYKNHDTYFNSIKPTKSYKSMYDNYGLNKEDYE